MTKIIEKTLRIKNCADCPFVGIKELGTAKKRFSFYYCENEAFPKARKLGLVKNIEAEEEFIPEWCPLEDEPLIQGNKIMKEHKWVTPNWMKFESLHKTFNKQISCISTGNQIGSTVFSSYIRAYNETECNKNYFPPGQLQEHDLDFVEAPPETREFIKHFGLRRKYILYVFFHWYKGKRIVHGAIITDPDYSHKKTFYLRNNYKSRSIINEARKYVCED